MTAKPTHRQLTTTLPWPFFPAVIVAIGVLLTLWMQRFSINGVVYSGDAGLKALVTQQLAQQLTSGQLPLDVSLNLAAPDWAQALWQQGLYPFTPPYAYEVGSQHFITFPFTFPLISAPFYALFGNRGLYIIPMVALWMTWARFWQISRRAGWGVGTLCIGLVALIFASPLSLYGGMFWEHTLSVALAFWGISELIYPARNQLHPRQLIGSGVLIALAAWFRPEFLCLIAAVSLLALIGWALPKWQIAPAISLRQAIALILSMAFTVGIFFALNAAIYGHPLGIHAIQIVEETAPTDQLIQAKTSIQQLFSAFARYFPLVWVVGIAALLSPEFRRASVKINPIKKFSKRDSAQYFGKLGIRTQSSISPVPGRYVIALSLLFALSVPLIVPPGAGGKQWGPRFFLILVPLLAWALSEQLRPALYRQWARRAILVGAAIALIFGIHLNSVRGPFTPYKVSSNTSLPANYGPISPAITALRSQPQPWVAMSHQYVAQQLWSALPGKTFFRTETTEQVKQLATELVAQNEKEFLYVCYPHRDCPFPETPESDLLLDNGSQLSLVYLDTYGKYPIYKVEIAS